ncbi:MULTISPECIES: response regulator transcription factor [unclassified Agarivorans]|uniref:response regulator transcription factor n=1 Tax=unclassified Agarivorans TaxID=2636026 RepID=UPI0026E3BE63|nr:MULTISPECIES: response regulator transcription factor [unclassified Agarivorans]MDO6687230.1 response regulator transcription factor [Agarivorans sp. 3_MG-2023]MDO6716843.1 response regulator transcription factor [Agarivorans sp. 2_MG-2023]MDO6765662.1 response regulator transcription factor [Agarivorans sp. 1_MG-2023]
MSPRILVIEDDHDINNLITMNLSDMMYQVESCENGSEGFAKASQDNFDLIVLDLMLPGMDGLDICRQLRAQQQNTPILMLTARDSEADRVVGLEMGADDYLTKPFSVRELQARVKAMLRRVDMLIQSQNQPAPSVMQWKDLTIDVARRLVSVREQAVELTSTEFDLLHHLAKSPGLVFSRAQLLDQVWGYKHSGYEHTVNSHINRLRTKLESDPSNPEYVLTVWGVGYKFNDV